MPFATLPAEPARELVELNVLAPVLLTRAVVPGMVERGEGAVINVASLLAFSGAWDRGLPAEARGVRGQQVVPRHVHPDPRGRAARHRRARAGRLPGLVRSEFHSRQGLDMSEVPRMDPESVVAASLHDLARGVVVSIPGADDYAALEAIEAASADLVPATRSVELPARYAEG